MKHQLNQAGFTIVELAVACVIFPIIVIGMSNVYGSIRQSYKIARQYNEMYAVLSACPEIDRALDYNALSGATNCFPNNVFEAEGGSGNTIAYNPTVSVTDTPSLPNGDPLQSVPDSKVIYITVPFQGNVAPALQLRMLITRNGIGQL